MWEDELKKIMNPETFDYGLVKKLIGSLLKQQWISVKERLPADGQYIVFAPDSVFEATIEGSNWYDCSGDEVEKLTDVTHWMPLPEPPKVRRRNETPKTT